MKRLMAMLVVVAVSLCNILIGVAAEDTAQKITRPLVTLTGTDSCVTHRSCFRVMSEEEWINILQRHKGEKESKDYDLQNNTRGLPIVDFKKCMVIAVFQGSGLNSAGLKATQILDENARIVLRIEDKSYQTMGPSGGGEKVSVYGFFVLPRSDKPVVVEENVQQYLGEPPVWKERATLPNIGSGAAAEDAVTKTTRPYFTLGGSDSHVKDPGFFRVASEEEWIKIWQRHKGTKETKDYDLHHNPLGLPNVDFEKCMVIAIFRGSSINSAGPRIEEVVEEKDQIIVRFTYKWYQTVDQSDNVAEYGFFVLPQSGKTVVLEESEYFMKDPPSRREVARLPK
jgi:hypothetical protein